jgi:CRP-like cAMP-binding protein
MMTARKERRHRIDTLRHVPLVASCTGRQLGRIDRIGTRIDVGAGRLLARQGDIGSECFIVLDGTAEVRGADGGLLGTITAGSIVGEMALIDRAPRNATVVARTPMRLIVLSAREFRELLVTAPPVGDTVDRIVRERRAG